MSLDASYILVYDVLGYVEPHPAHIDYLYLYEEYGGYFNFFNHGYSVYWEKPKYLLPREDLEKLLADQVLERKDGERWEIIK